MGRFRSCRYLFSFRRCRLVMCLIFLYSFECLYFSQQMFSRANSLCSKSSWQNLILNDEAFRPSRKEKCRRIEQWARLLLGLYRTPIPWHARALTSDLLKNHQKINAASETGLHLFTARAASGCRLNRSPRPPST